MEDALYWTFSTIAQTLAGAIALMGAFVLFAVNRLKEKIGFYSKNVAQDHSGKPHIWDHYMRGEHAEVLRLAKEDQSKGKKTDVVRLGIGSDESFKQLSFLVPKQEELSRRCRWSVRLTGITIAGSVGLLALTPSIHSNCVLSGILLSLGVGAVIVCLVSYAKVIRAAIE